MTVTRHEELKSALDHIELSFRRIDLPVARLLQPGLSAGELDKAEGILARQLPSELRAMYEWRNGTLTRGRILDDTHFFPGFYFVALGDALAHWNAFRGDSRWREGWFPVFGNGGGDFFVMECDAKPKDRAPVIGFMLGEDSHQVEYLSLTVMLQTISECFDQGVYYQTSEGFLETHIEQEEEIARRRNPGVDRWRP